MTKRIRKKHTGTAPWLMVLVAVLAAMTGLAFGESGKAPDRPVVIKSGKGNITFFHDEHAKVDGGCSACHSMFPQKNGQIEALKASGEFKGKAVMNMCRDCHGKLMAADRETGPTADCMGCHGK